MNNLEILAARVHAKRSTYSEKLTQAQTIIVDALRLCSSPYVAISFGKDSAVMLDLVQKYQPDIEARFIRWSESQYLDDFDRVIREWKQRGINLKVLDLHRDHIDEKGGDRWDQLQQLSPCDGFFVGLRAEENRNSRGRTLSIHGTIYQMKNGLYRICPLAWWTTDDVAAYTITHDLPLLNAYKSDGFQQRTSARVPRATVRGQSLHDLKLRDPQRFSQLSQKYPEVLEYV